MAPLHKPLAQLLAAAEMILLLVLLSAEVITAATNDPNAVSALRFIAAAYGMASGDGDVSNKDEALLWLFRIGLAFEVGVGSVRCSACCD